MGPDFKTRTELFLLNPTHTLLLDLCSFLIHPSWVEHFEFKVSPSSGTTQGSAQSDIFCAHCASKELLLSFCRAHWGAPVQWVFSVASSLASQGHLALMPAFSAWKYCLGSPLIFALLSLSSLYTQPPVCVLEYSSWFSPGPLSFSLCTLLLSGLLYVCGFNYKLHTEFADLYLNPWPSVQFRCPYPVAHLPHRESEWTCSQRNSRSSLIEWSSHPWVPYLGGRPAPHSVA